MELISQARANLYDHARLQADDTIVARPTIPEHLLALLDERAADLGWKINPEGYLAVEVCALLVPKFFEESRELAFLCRITFKRAQQAVNAATPLNRGDVPPLVQDFISEHLSQGAIRADGYESKAVVAVLDAFFGMPLQSR